MNIEEQIKQLESRLAPGHWQGVTVGPGWYRLVLDCDKELSSIDPHYRIYQVKEKYGTLRYYAKCSSRMPVDLAPKMQEVIDKYEKLSASTCEITGRPGVLMGCGGWLKTLNPALVRSDPGYSGYTPVE